MLFFTWLASGCLSLACAGSTSTPSTRNQVERSTNSVRSVAVVPSTTSAGSNSFSWLAVASLVKTKGTPLYVPTTRTLFCANSGCAARKAASLSFVALCTLNFTSR